MKKVPNIFKQINSLEKRTISSRNIIDRHPGKIPVILLLSPDIGSKESFMKYLVSADIGCLYLLTLVRRSIIITESKSIFLLTDDGTMLTSSKNISDLYASNKNEDGYLYISVYLENTFG